MTFGVIAICSNRHAVRVPRRATRLLFSLIGSLRCGCHILSLAQISKEQIDLEIILIPKTMLSVKVRNKSRGHHSPDRDNHISFFDIEN